MSDDDLLDEFGIGGEQPAPVGTAKETVVAATPGIFNKNALGAGIAWDTCTSGQAISMQASFVQSATFSAALFGKPLAP